jgi:hypothetical protein
MDESKPAHTNRLGAGKSLQAPLPQTVLQLAACSGGSTPASSKWREMEQNDPISGSSGHPFWKSVPFRSCEHD